MNTPCPRCGSRNTTPLTGFAHHCHACQRNFGFAEPQQVIRAADEVQRLHFFTGGYFGSNFEITLCSAENEALSPHECCLKPTRFKRIIRRLFRRYHLADWNPRYEDSDILDGTHWSLTLQLKDASELSFSGCNAYPPHYRQLLRILSSLQPQ